jgi:cell division protein ZapA (FtsZ GTPase activity inhibitor)
VKSQLAEQLITIELFGEKFNFKADEGHLKAEEIAEYLKRELENVETQLPTHAAKSNKLAVMALVALNISKQYIELLHKHIKFVNSVSARTARLGAMIKTKQ